MTDFQNDVHFLNKVKERAYYLYLNNVYDTDLERYYDALQYESSMYIYAQHSQAHCDLNCVCKFYVWCNICDLYSDKTFGLQCKCNTFYCISCIRKYLFNKKINHINKIIDYNDYKIQCPTFDKCETGFYVKDFITKDEYYGLVNKIDFKIYYCIEPDCNGTIKDNHCSTCYSEVCHNCNTKAHQDDCNSENVDALNCLLDYAGNNINKCPSCNMVLFLKHGCENVFCWNCSVMFNWVSGEISHQFSFSGQNYYNIYKGQIGQIEEKQKQEEKNDEENESEYEETHLARYEHFMPGNDEQDYLEDEMYHYIEEDYL
jgi:hypothetical protein